jgi:hypothetical protein
MHWVFDLQQLDLNYVLEQSGLSLPILFVKVFVSVYNNLVRASSVLERVAHALDVVCPKWVLDIV